MHLKIIRVGQTAPAPSEDIFFFDTKGNCIYSVYKELDFATNFAANGNGEWKDSGGLGCWKLWCSHDGFMYFFPLHPFLRRIAAIGKKCLEKADFVEDEFVYKLTLDSDRFLGNSISRIHV